MSYIVMYDSLSMGNIPGDAQAVAGYVNGDYITYGTVQRSFPNAKHVSIAVNVDAAADFLDIEHGDAVISQAGGWLDARLKEGAYRPGIYAQMSYWESGGMASDLAGFGSKIRRWVADWTYQEHIPGGYDGCQWSGGRTLDISACLPTFFGPAPDLDPHHYKWFFDRKFVIKEGPTNERECVLKYDGARLHPVKYHLYMKRDLEPRLRHLADRIARNALYEHKDGKVVEKNGKPVKRKHAEWDKDYRGWRYQQLLARADGKQIVK